MRILEVFGKSSFAMAILMFLIMGFFVLIGNPRITDGNTMCWHHIPELFGIYFIGFWGYEIKMKFRYVFLIYISAVLMIPILLGNSTIFTFVLAAIISAPLLLGYYIGKKGDQNEKA